MLDIPRYLPHRYPFLLVDRVIELERGKSIVAYKNITHNEPMFNGHFPGEPIFPGVLIIEALAQAAGLLGSHYFATKDNSDEVEVVEDSLYLFVGADKTRFKRPVIPGDRLMLEARVIAGRSKIWKFDCKAHVDGEHVCGSQILCALRNRPS